MRPIPLAIPETLLIVNKESDLISKENKLPNVSTAKLINKPFRDLPTRVAAAVTWLFYTMMKRLFHHRLPHIMWLKYNHKQVHIL